MSGSRKRSASKRITVVPPAEPLQTRSASAEERDEPDLKRQISEEVQKAVTSALVESVAPLLVNLSGTSVSPSQLGTGTEKVLCCTARVTILKNQLAELGIRFNNFNDLAPAATVAANKKTWRERTRQTSRGQT